MSFGDFLVRKRDGTVVPLNMEEITRRNRELLRPYIVDGRVIVEDLGASPGTSFAGLSPTRITMEVIVAFKTEFAAHVVPTEVIDLMTVSCLQNLWTDPAGPEHQKLAGRIVASCLQKTCAPTFSEFVSRRNATAKGRVTDAFAAIVREHAAFLDGLVDARRDFILGFTAMRTLVGAYLHSEEPALGVYSVATTDPFASFYQVIRSKFNTRVVETPQYAYLRAAVAVYADLLASSDPPTVARGRTATRALYDALSLGHGSLASPFIFNAGSTRKKSASCILMAPADTLASILTVEMQAGVASSGAAGIGVGWDFPRAAGAPIATTGGHATGVPSWILGHANKCDTVTQGS